MKILLVDDTSENLAIGKKEIEKLYVGSIVDTCGNFNEAMRIIIPNSGYDAVLTDLYMPAVAVNPGEMTPYGFTIALRAALMGIKHIAIVTDGGHHDSAINDSLDYLGLGMGDENYEYPRKPYAFSMNLTEETVSNFTVNGAKLVIVDSFKFGDINDTEEDYGKFGFSGALKVLLKP